MSGNQNVLFFQGLLHGLQYQMHFDDLLISCQYASVYPYQLKQSLSTEPDKRLLNGLFWNLIDTCRLVFSYYDSLQFENELIFQLYLILAAKVK